MSERAEPTPVSEHAVRSSRRALAPEQETAANESGSETATGALDADEVIRRAELTAGPVVATGASTVRVQRRSGAPAADSTSEAPTIRRVQRAEQPATPAVRVTPVPVRVQRSGLGDWVKGRLGWGAGTAPAVEKDPMQKVHDEFMQRITSLQSEIPQLKGQNIAATGEALWSAYCGTISGTKGMSGAGGEVALAGAGLSNKVPQSSSGMRDNSATNPMYYNEGPGAAAAAGEQLQQGSYKTNMSESFNLLTNALKGLSQLQFDKYKTFAFWNSPGAKDVAVAAKSGGVLALESSAIGGLFDKFGSYEQFSKGIESDSWDPQLWAELSRAYASMVMDAIVKDRSKKIVVICGLGFDNPSYNIWNSIESLTLKLGAARAKLVEQDLIDVTTYLGVAGHLDADKNPVVDMTASCEGVAGTWVSARSAAEMTLKQREQTQATTRAVPA